MALTLPMGKRLAVSIGVDFDAHSAWIGAFARQTPGYLSRGQYDAVVGVPRLLNLLKRYNIRTTFFTPSHTMATFPDAVEQILRDGHEIAAHGCYHENPNELDSDEEHRLMEVSLALHLKHVGRLPVGHRSPAWDFSDATYEILLKNGFKYDSSLMARDFEAYRPQSVNIDREKGDTFGTPWEIVEYPVSWYLDDFPHLELIPGIIHGPFDAQQLVDMWKKQFDYAYEYYPGGVFCLTIHPGTIARAHHIAEFESFLKYVAGKTGVWLAPLESIHSTWAD